MLGYRAGKNVPFTRQLADAILPYSWKDYLRNEVLNSSRDEFVPRQEYFLWRYMSVNALFERLKPEQGVEFAAGFSPRGLEAACEGYKYFESDRADVMSAKCPAVQKILGNHPLLTLDSLDVSNQPALVNYLIGLPAGRTAFILEALWPYITWRTRDDLMAKLQIFLKYLGGGAVIVTDVYLQGDLQEEMQRRLQWIATLPPEKAQTLTAELDRHWEWVRTTHFVDFQRAHDYFASFGYQVKALDIGNVERELQADSRPYGLSLDADHESVIWLLEIPS